jgi:hypothetical protein
MDIGELQQILAQGPASLTVEDYFYHSAQLTVSLCFGDGAPLTLGLVECRHFVGAFQGQLETLSVEAADGWGWRIVGETTRVTFGRLRRLHPGAPEPAITCSSFAEKDIKVIDEEAERAPPQPGDLDSDGMRKPYDEATLTAYFAAAPALLFVASYQTPGWGSRQREMYVAVNRGRALDFTLLMLHDVTFYAGTFQESPERPDSLVFRRIDGGFEIVGERTTLRFGSFSLGVGRRVLRSSTARQ